MMKTLKHTSAALMLALAALASGCAADEEMTTSTPTDGEDDELMTITVSTGSDATTRVAYDDSKVGSPDNDALTWQEGDQIVVIGRDDSNTYKGKEEYTLVAADAGKTIGSFTGKAITGATQYFLAYKNTATQVGQDGDFTYSSNALTQAGDGCTAHLKDNLFLATTTAITDLSNVRLEMKCAILKFDLSGVPAEVGALKKLTWTAEGSDGNSSMELAFSQKEEEKVTFNSSKQTLTAYLVFAPNDMRVKTGGKFTVTLKGDKTYYAERTITGGKSYEQGKRYTATIDGTAATMEWKEKVESVVVSTTVSGDNNYYNGLEMQIGTWEADAPGEQTLLGEATVADGQAVIPVNLSAYIGKPIWVCIPKVAKFFHTLTQEEANAEALTLPDKDGGSTLKVTPAAGGEPYANDWIVALYMGVNKDGSTAADATPLYWATGNLIATKTNAAGSTPDAAFHIATAEETLAEASTSTYSVPTGIANSTTIGYKACALGAQWNKFGWGDATGLNTSTNNADYAKDITATGTIISGNAAYDIARAQLGGSWRLPTGGSGKANELAAFADNSASNLPPDGTDWTVSAYTGREYTYTDDNGITNTLRFPAAGYRQDKEAKELGIQGFYWSGTANSYGKGREFHFSQSEARQGYNTDRASGLSVRPVTE